MCCSGLEGREKLKVTDTDWKEMGRGGWAVSPRSQRWGCQDLEAEVVASRRLSVSVTCL